MGQLNELYHYAQTHNVRHIVLAVGANDFDFSGVTKQCMEIYLRQTSLTLASAVTTTASSRAPSPCRTGT